MHIELAVELMINMSNAESTVRLCSVQGPNTQLLHKNLFCKACKSDGMPWHCILHSWEIKRLIEFLEATPILQFYATHDEVCDDRLT